jgi:hypothetical protein
MIKLLALLSIFSTLSVLGPALAYEEGFKVYCNSEYVIGKEAHRDHIFPIPRVADDRLVIKLASQDQECSRKQDAAQKSIYQWLPLPNKELPYILNTYTWSGTNTTTSPETLGTLRLNSSNEISFEEAPAELAKVLNDKIWYKDHLTLVTLSPKLKDLLGKKLAQEILSGKTNFVKVQLVARREFHSGGERFILEIKRESNNNLYAKLVK